jgi:hypothetical protein
MTQQLQRLERLMRAQGKLMKGLEERLMREERTIASLQQGWMEMNRFADSAVTVDPASLPALLRRLAAAELTLKKKQLETDDLRRELLSARAREKIVSERVRQLREARERQVTEASLLETALAMAAKVSRKRSVVS